ncbi:MAG: right-handed parallel beta-helix repeat-containing protein [Chloroflexota bacterium]
MKKFPFPIVVIVLLSSLIFRLSPAWGGQAAPKAAVYYVAPGGDYANPGTEASPTTLEGARDKIRALGTLPAGGVTVYLRGGVYMMAATFELGAQDSGSDGSPVTYRAYAGETPILSGGASLDPAWFTQVTDSSPVWGRLAPAAQGKLWQVTLPAHGLDDYGTLVRRGFSANGAIAALELAFNGEMMELARWPNRGHTDPFDEDAPALVSGALSPDVSGTFVYMGTTASGSADDGFPNYRRDGLVGGQQFYLYHCTWTYQDTQPKYWFISTHDPVSDPNCWPSSGPAWLAQGNDPRVIPPLEDWSGTSGTATARTQPEDYAAHGFIRIPQTSSDTSFQLPGTRHQRWSQAGDIWFQGLFDNYWADDTIAGTIDGSGVVTLADEPGYGISVGQPFAALNLLEEIDIPGEWYLDRASGTLYFWPPAGLNGSQIGVSLLEEPLLAVNGAGYVRFEGITFELGRDNLAEVRNAGHVQFNHCTFRNAGRNAVDIGSSSNSGVNYGTIYNLGAGGVLLSGGSRPELTPAYNFVRNSEIHHYGRWDRTYRPAIRLSGVGQIAEHNEIHDAPHAAILFSGNEHQMRYNEIGYVVQESNDAGAIYAGRDWGYRGNDISYNFIHHIESVFGGSHGIYLDDAVSGMRVFGNVLYRIRGSATVNGGGRDNLAENNVIAAAEKAHSTDRRAQSWATNTFESNGCPDDWNLLGRITIVYETCYTNHLEAIDYQHGTWAASYPTLATIPNDWGQVNDTHWLEPEGSTFTCNSAWEVESLITQSSLGGSNALDWYAKYDNNLEADPLFVDEANLNLALRPDSPVYSQLSCFTAIPFEEIGIEEIPALDLQGIPDDGRITLNWEVNVTLPATTTWTITYTGTTGDEPSPIGGIEANTRSYTLTGLANYEWYDITLTTDPPLLTDTVRAMPTGWLLSLPLVRR